MVKYQILSILFWPDIKYKKPTSYSWTLQDLYLRDKSIVIEFVKGEEKIIILLDRYVAGQRGRISKNFRMSVCASDVQEYRHIYQKNKKFIRHVSAVIKKNDTADFLFLEDSDYYNKNPFGLVFSVTHRCNMSCKFCFNSYDYSLKDRNVHENLSTKDVKKILDNIYNDGVRYLILSGGEPMMREDIVDIIEYAHKKKFYIVLNTNGTLFNEKLVKKICQFPVHVMLSMHEFNDKDSYIKTGRKKVFSKRLEVVKLFRKYDVLCLEYITALQRENIDNLDSIYNMNLGEYAPDSWQFFRVLDSNGEPGSSPEEMRLAIDKLYSLNKKFDLKYKIVDAVPFCVSDNPHKASEVVSGELNEEHLVKMVTDPKGNVKMMCSFDLDLGNILHKSIKDIWESDMAKNMINLNFTPTGCDGCIFWDDCCGGSRFVARVRNGSYSSEDPLVNYRNKKTTKNKN
jgi:radical SAM protein with 4Fe4S-binding SPASM domain